MEKTTKYSSEMYLQSGNQEYLTTLSGKHLAKVFREVNDYPVTIVKTII